MATTRAKKKIFSNVSLDDAQAASERYALTSNRLAKIEARMNEEINKVKSRYTDEITDLNERLVEPMEILNVYASEQKTTWGKRKSLELLHCIIGFRTGTPKVSKDKKFTWDAVLELMKRNKVFARFIRTKEEINKEAIIAEKNEALLNQLTEECYITIDQDETFFVQPKVEELQNT